MRTSNNDQSAVWQAAFAEGLARGEAAFGEATRSAVDFAESYAFLVEAEQRCTLTAPETTTSEVSKHDINASWAKVFQRFD
jgi:hypothetical protein